MSLALPFKRVTMIDAVKEATGIDFGAFRGDTEKAREAAKELRLEIKESDTWGNILNLAFEEKVEDTLIQPTFVCDYPIEVSPLTKKKKGMPGAGRTVRAVYHRKRICQCLFRAERSH